LRCLGGLRLFRRGLRRRLLRRRRSRRGHGGLGLGGRLDRLLRRNGAFGMLLLLAHHLEG
ncbi:MAG TPA: hypothetical protein VNT03_19030, partial [Baekduia sp.]|nr:hypothetical protein [Baekduia sp.]